MGEGQPQVDRVLDRQQTSAAATQAGAGRTATHAELLQWVEAVAGGPVTSCHAIAGGNRCQSWAVDVAAAGGGVRELYLRYQPPRPPSAEPYTVWREAKIYAALLGTAVPAPRLIAVNPEVQAILTERAPGSADYRRIADERQRVSVIAGFIAGLAALHRLPLKPDLIPGLTPNASIADCVRRELDVWRAMYAEAGRADPLIDLALDWLAGNVPNARGHPVLVHGDAGPGNFLFEDGRLTALLDWELAHPGDPMEDLAWFSMRAVMEPVPDFARAIRDYGQLMGAAADAGRILYHRVFVSTRVVIIRHRNVTGLPGNSIVSRALNRRLLVDALAGATGVTLPAPLPVQAQATAQTPLYDAALRDLRDDIAAASTDPRVVAAAKNAAKVVKYLREVDRFGAVIKAQELTALEALLGHAPASIAAGQAELLRIMREDRLPFTAVLAFFAGSTQREAVLAASASGGLAGRSFPSLAGIHPSDV